METKKNKITSMVIFILILTLLVGGIIFSYFFINRPKTKEFTIEAQRFKFTPGILVVNKGDEVILKIKSLDVEHGFYIDGYEIEASLPALRTVTLTFTADSSGNFKIRCAVTCGNFHPYMIGELRVQPNTLFYLSILLSALLAIVMVSKSYKQANLMQDRGVITLTDIVN